MRPPRGEGQALDSPPGEGAQCAACSSIGEFSRLTHLSVRTLRRYHDAGLLEPATVDDASGYRYYSVDQIPTAQVIHRLRELDVPLADVQRILRSPDPARGPPSSPTTCDGSSRSSTGPAPRWRRCADCCARSRRRLHVELRAVPTTTVAAVEDDVERDDVLAWYAGAMAELDARRASRPVPRAACTTTRCSRPVAGTCSCTGRRAEPPRSGRVHPVTLPAVELAVTTHVGEHDDIDVTYGELGAWVVANALAVAGPVRETYLVGPRDTADPTAWRTEIGWPVFRVASPS